MEKQYWLSAAGCSDDTIWSVLQKVNAHELVGRLEHQLDTMIVNHQYFFSGGERQRLALARILLRQPKILIMDEATSSLDAENEKLIMEVLKDLTDKVTVIFVTHRSSVLQWCDAVIRIPEE
jgi:ABC-type bacteriocin/lantibiotic exporter with double-glycine peptidase domain